MSLNQQHKNNKYVYVKCITWFRDSHGLFDYDAARYTESDSYIDNSLFINRDHNDFMRISDYNLDNGVDETFRSELDGCELY